jgi:hypothetical protein
MLFTLVKQKPFKIKAIDYEYVPQEIFLQRKTICVSDNQIQYTVDKTWDMIANLEVNGYKPRYVSVTPDFYEIFIASCSDEDRIQLPESIIGLDVIVNPNQKENVIVLCNAKDEYFRSWDDE